MSRILKKLCLVEIVLLLALVSTASAKTTGKIAGTVVSAEDGEPLAGATVSIVGQSIVTVTDLDGEFYILNLPAASYDIAVELIGYKTEIRSMLKVLPDLTTPVEIDLIPTTVQLDSVVTVVAERPLIQKDITASTRTITREEIGIQPNSRNIGQVILRMNGAVSDEDGALHIRGGRLDEVTYYFDGMPVQDQFSGGLGTRINPDALEAVTLTSGGYTAEYGEALSGVVNALTQEGTSRYVGKLKLADGLSKPYNVHTGEFDGTRRTDNYYGVFNLSGPLPLFESNRANFFNSVEYWNNGGYLPHNQGESWTVTSKLSVRPTQNLKLTFYTNLYDREQQRYEHRDVNGYSYDFALQNSGLIKNDAARVGSTATLQLSANTMVSFKAGYFETKTKLAPDHLFDVYWDQWPGYSVDENGNYNGTIQDNYGTDSTYWYTGYVNDTLFYPYYLYKKSSYKSVGFDLLSQVNKHHLLSFGGEYRQNRLIWDNKQFFNTRPYGEKYDVGPSYAAAYAQDKIELGYMIINAGLRLDYLNAEIDYWDNPAQKNQLLRSKSKTHLSPRLGFSHPVSENTLFHANYGYYYQVPQYPYMFTNLQADLTTGYPIVGNPDMEPERTISYELGITQKLDEDIRMNATTYYKDVSNLVSAMFIETPSGTGFTQYVNGDYGSVKGLDLSLTKSGNSNLNGSIAYTYMIAEGNSSSASEFYYDYFTRGEDAPVMPVQEFPLAFDQRHTLNVNADFRVPRGQNLKLFGLKVPSAWGLSTFFTYGSGMPYTRTDEAGLRLGGLNEARMPATYRVDMRFDKDFFLTASSSTKLRFFVEVTNLFDRRNVVNVYSRSGLPDVDGSIASSYDPPGDPTTDDVNALRSLLARDPQNYDAPRSIQWGLEWIF